MSNFTGTIEITLTPEKMAQVFWSMTSEEQAMFFVELAKTVKEDHKTNRHAYSFGELQWFYLADELKQHDDAKSILMSMASPLYLNVLRFAEGGAA